jgi:hypothetical protein
MSAEAASGSGKSKPGQATQAKAGTSAATPAVAAAPPPPPSSAGAGAGAGAGTASAAATTPVAPPPQPPRGNPLLSEWFCGVMTAVVLHDIAAGLIIGFVDLRAGEGRLPDALVVARAVLAATSTLTLCVSGAEAVARLVMAPKHGLSLRRGLDMLLVVLLVVLGLGRGLKGGWWRGVVERRGGGGAGVTSNSRCPAPQGARLAPRGCMLNVKARGSSPHAQCGSNRGTRLGCFPVRAVPPGLPVRSLSVFSHAWR